MLYCRELTHVSKCKKIQKKVLNVRLLGVWANQQQEMFLRPLPLSCFFSFFRPQIGDLNKTLLSIVIVVNAQSARTVASPPNVHVMRLVSKGQQARSCCLREAGRVICSWGCRNLRLINRLIVKNIKRLCFVVAKFT